MQKSEPLTAAESEALRAIVASRGLDAAAKCVGLCDVRTLAKAACGAPVSTLTARVIRGALTNGVQCTP